MIGALVGLHARRTATPAALAIVVGAGVVAFLGAPTGASLVTTSSVFLQEVVLSGDSGAQSAWTATLVVMVVLTLLPAARVAQRWFLSEGDWLGTAPAPRVQVIASSLCGVMLGSGLLAATAGVVTSTRTLLSDHAEPLLECAAIAGPRRSIVLMPGESFEQAIADVAIPDGTRVRVRVTPTLGGASPTTDAWHGSTGDEHVERVARRTWLESSASTATNSVRVTNVGEGALAVIGPGPVEVWRPSRALGRGHVRLAAHVGLFLCVLAALAFTLGAWMSPGVAALLAFSLWLGARMLIVGSAYGQWLPGGDGLAESLNAIAEGRSPLRPAFAAVVATIVTCALAIAATAPALHSWRKEIRS